MLLCVRQLELFMIALYVDNYNNLNGTYFIPTANFALCIILGTSQQIFL